MRPTALFVFFGLALFARPCCAQFIIYETRANFLAAAAGASYNLANEDFSTDPGSTFTISAPGGSVELTRTSNTAHTANGDLRTINSASGTTGLSGTVSGSVRGIGFDFGSNSAGTNASISYNGTGVNGGGGKIAGFLGILATDGSEITSIQGLTVNQVLFSTMRIDNVVIAAVPEPSSIALMGVAGIGALTTGRRRRR